MLGKWIRPWPGENVVGWVVSVHGDVVRCRAVGGLHFEVSLAALKGGKGEIFTRRPMPIRTFGNKSSFAPIQYALVEAS
jgi:hypothetical protein